MCVTNTLSHFFLLLLCSVFSISTYLLPYLSHPCYTPTLVKNLLSRLSLLAVFLLVAPDALSSILATSQAVPLLIHPPAPVAEKFYPLCTKGRRGAGCYISLLLVKYSPTKIHTFRSIPTSA